MSSESTRSVCPEGYKRVQLGPREITLPVEWEIAPVRELFDIEKDSFDPSVLESGSDVMLYSMPAYDSNKEPNKTPVSEIGSKKYRVPQDTVLFPKLNIRKRRFWRVRHDHSLPAVCSTEYWPLLPKTSLELDFYHYYFDSYEFTSNPKVTSSSSTNSHKRVKQSSFEKLQLPVPPLPEQRRIADILSMVDEQIQQTDKMIEKIGDLRQGLSSDLLTQGINGKQTKSTPIGTVPSSWELKRGHQFITLRNGKYISADERMESAEYPVYGGNGIMAQYDDWLVEPNTIIVGRVGAYCGNVHITDSEAWVTDNAIIARVDESKTNPYFVAETLQKANLKRFASRSAQPRISQSVIETLLMPVASMQEQNKIVDILSTVDNWLEQERNHKQVLQELKRGLMQDLLTGKVRVDTD